MGLLEASFVSLLSLSSPSFDEDSYTRASLALPIAETDIGSIRVRPDSAKKIHGRYQLLVYSNNKEDLLISLERPRRGEITNIEFDDIDGDNINELVVEMTDGSSGIKRIKRDIYELKGQHRGNTPHHYMQNLKALPVFMKLIDR
ncbi:MAG: hypothetical protein ACWA5U_08885 [bacterium]